jgi:beta-glucanase (GH16 family)
MEICPRIKPWLLGVLGPTTACFCLFSTVCAAHAQSNWNITWSDEFEGNAVNLTNWTFETGNNNGWGNSELEYYTGRPQNSFITNGILHIAAQRESYAGLNYTSARMTSRGRFEKAYGRFEFRAKLPSGLGFWPALWLLGSDIGTVGWPACGEVDVMENKGSALGRVQGTLHFSDSLNHHLQETAYFDFSNGDSVTNFHTYALEWSTNLIRWEVDGQVYETQTNWSSSTGAYPAPFNARFFIVLNLAVGGAYLGNPSTNTINASIPFPGELMIDYVRVLELTDPLEISTHASGQQLVLTWPDNIVCHLQTQQAGQLSNQWSDVPAAKSPYTIPLQRGAVFYRLESP